LVRVITIDLSDIDDHLHVLTTKAPLELYVISTLSIDSVDNYTRYLSALKNKLKKDPFNFFEEQLVFNTFYNLREHIFNMIYKVTPLVKGISSVKIDLKQKKNITIEVKIYNDES
jgi:hypothetical protein